MTTITQPVRRTVPWNRIAAGAAWLGGVATTYLFFQAAMPELGAWIAIAIAVVLQWILTLAERPLWRALLKRGGGRLAGVALIVTFFDGLLNAAGIYPFASRLGQTDLGLMLAEVFGLQATVGSPTAFVVAFLAGLLVASLPEALWES